MKKFVIMMILIMLTSLSFAIPENKLSNQVGSSLGNAKLSQIVDPSSSENTVNIKSYSFQPATLSVPAGTTVTWHNQDSVQHTVTSDVQGLFDSGVIAPGKKFTYTFPAPGSYSYHCSIHPGMKGTIVVAGTSDLQATQSPVTRTLLSTSAIQGINPGLAQGNSGNGGSPSWSEKPLSGQTTAVSGGTEGAVQSKSLALNLNIPVGQSAGLSSMQSAAVASTQPSTQSSAIQQFSQYYRSTSEVPKDQLTSPTKIDLKGIEPDTIYFGSTQKAVPYSQYQTYALTTGANSLWIQGASSWTQYAMVPLGSMLTMITMSPTGGQGYLYEVYPDSTLDKNGYYFYPYNQIGFYADQVGEHQLFFNIDGQPSNVIVIDVIAYQPPAPPVYSFASVTISSSWLRGYNVYVDGSIQATEGTTGEPDGIVTISVLGDRYHNIAIDGSGFTFSDYKYFNAGYAYSLNV
jgi:plastocyanin